MPIFSSIHEGRAQMEYSFGTSVYIYTSRVVRMLHRFKIRYYLHYQYGWSTHIYLHQTHPAFLKIAGFRFQNQPKDEILTHSF